MGILKRLNEPDLVAKFQKYCGVDIRVERDGETISSAGVATDDAVARNSPGKQNSNGVQPHARPGLRSSSKNGHVQNGTVQNGVSSTKHSKTENYTSNDKVFHTINNKLLHIIFNVAAAIGNEPFYCCLWPLWFWTFDGYICRRVAFIWCMTMYVGQATKDIVKWPRPASPPVVRLEREYDLEYGMPSTHAMVAASIPFSAYALFVARYEFPYAVGFAIAFCWCVLVCTSRLYLGMHSVLDVLAGLLYIGILVPMLFPFLNALDLFIATHPYAPVLSVIVPLFLCIFYPSQERWNTARGDTTIILGVGSGICVATWLNYQHGYLKPAETPPPYTMELLDENWLRNTVLRLLIGGAMVALTRLVVKPCSFYLVCYIIGLEKKDLNTERHEKQRLELELPYKFITYFSLAAVTIYVAPIIFRYLSIDKYESIYELT